MNAWKERGIAGILFAMTALLLLTQLDMGYSRDESFYFRYARSYAGWFAALDAASSDEEAQEVLSRDKVVGTWKGNFEHPPLMKTAFGASWRHLSRKYRSVAFSGAEPRVTGLGPADGFSVGAEVQILAPVPVGGNVQDAGRVLGETRVARRSPRAARLEPLTQGVSVVETCKRRPGDGAEPLLLTGCQVVELLG